MPIRSDTGSEGCNKVLQLRQVGAVVAAGLGSLSIRPGMPCFQHHPEEIETARDIDPLGFVRGQSFPRIMRLQVLPPDHRLRRLHRRAPDSEPCSPHTRPFRPDVRTREGLCPTPPRGRQVSGLTSLASSFPSGAFALTKCRMNRPSISFAAVDRVRIVHALAVGLSFFLSIARLCCISPCRVDAGLFDPP